MRVRPVGAEQEFPVDVRVVSATNKDVIAQVVTDRFRKDLYGRLAQWLIHLPPLRERREDILPLADALLLRIGAELGKPGLRLTPEAAAWVRAQPWLGNVRELANSLERASILAERLQISSDLLIPAGPSKSGAADYNERLSQQRAESIVALIAQTSRDARSRFKAAGRGFQDTIVGTGANDATDAIDRRVEFRVRSCT